jgi:endo-1,4-beta-mannosidase
MAVGPWVGANFWSRAGGPRMWTERFDEDVVREELAVLARHGLNVTRSFFFLPDFMPGPYTIDEACLERYARFLDLSVEVGIATIPTFVVGHMSGQNWDVAWRGGRDLYADGWMLARQAWFARTLAERFGGHRAVVAWLLSNEMPLYGGQTGAEYGRSWAEVLAQAVRAGGALQPVSTGDGAWGVEVTGHDNGFRLRDLRSTVDFLGPHVYPSSNDAVRQHLAAAFTCELCQVGLPVVLEEFGVSSAFASDEHAADYYRQVLHTTLLAGSVGWIAWNNTDFDLVGEDPYRHHPFELRFGITGVDGTPKAPLRELQRFRHLLVATGFDGCRRAPTSTALIVPSYLDAGYPFSAAEERRLVREVTFQGYVAAREAGLAPALWRELEPLAAAPRLVLAPSLKALTGPSWYRLEELARAGATVYVSFFSGGTGVHRGSWCPDLDCLFGVEHELRYGLVERVDESLVVWTMESAFGDLEAGSRLEFPVAGSEHGRARLPLRPAGSTVLARDGCGRPALVARRVGEGTMVLSAYPVEYFAASRPSANPEATWRLYRALAAHAGVEWTVRSRRPDVLVDALVDASGALLVWLVSESSEPVCAEIELARPGDQLVDVETGRRVGPEVELPAYGVRVCRVVVPGFEKAPRTWGSGAGYEPLTARASSAMAASSAPSCTRP